MNKKEEAKWHFSSLIGIKLDITKCDITVPAGTVSDRMITP